MSPPYNKMKNIYREAAAAKAAAKAAQAAAVVKMHAARPVAEGYAAWVTEVVMRSRERFATIEFCDDFNALPAKVRLPLLQIFDTDDHVVVVRAISRAVHPEYGPPTVNVPVVIENGLPVATAEELVSEMIAGAETAISGGTEMFYVPQDQTSP